MQTVTSLYTDDSTFKTTLFAGYNNQIKHPDSLVSVIWCTVMKAAKKIQQFLLQWECLFNCYINLWCKNHVVFNLPFWFWWNENHFIMKTRKVIHKLVASNYISIYGDHGEVVKPGFVFIRSWVQIWTMISGSQVHF